MSTTYRVREPQEWGSKARKAEANTYRSGNRRASIEANIAEWEDES